ncbi:kinase-like domain-containing protein [Aspergillus heterothallicus]
MILSTPPPQDCPELTTTDSVLDYLHSRPLDSSSNTIIPFLTPHAIRRITLGSTNYTYRLFLPPSSTTKSSQTNGATTAILKYASAYTAGDPRVRFDPARQAFEVRAMAEIPWSEIIPAERQDLPQVNIPRVYFTDPARRVIIMEDGTPRMRRKEREDATGVTMNSGSGESDGDGDDGVWEERSHSSRIFLEEIPASQEKFATANVLGKTLGMFLARMHNWGRDETKDEVGAKQWVREAFGGNTHARDLTIQEAIEDFWTGVRCCDTDALAESQEGEVRKCLEGMRERILTDYETLVMGDFWLGNVLLTFSNTLSTSPSLSPITPNIAQSLPLDTISIIDWEFAMAGPAFLDVGNFIGEVFLINYFERNDEVYTRLLEAFIAEYEAHTPPEKLNTGMILSYAGAHIVQALPRRINSPRRIVGEYARTTGP